MHVAERAARDVVIARILVVSVVIFTIGFLVETFSSNASVWQEAVYALLGCALAFSAFAHVLCHLGYVLRLRNGDRGGQLTAHNVDPATCLGALIPTYREEPDFVFRAMLSVALQRHDRKWLRLLVDDPPTASSDDDRRLLLAARELPDRVRAFLRPLDTIVAEAVREGARDVTYAPKALTHAHQRIADKLEHLAREWAARGADDVFFKEAILRRLASEHRADAGKVPSEPEQAAAELVGLQERFRCDVATFERKRYTNLSHAANKAMNLNVAIDLVGRSVSENHRPNGIYLDSAPGGNCVIPDAEYLMTLDADSLLAPDYAAQLLEIMTAEGCERVAVAQTPYAAQPGAITRLESIAGATTDVQRVLHQGFARFDAAFWVGANAILRVAALRDIATEDRERGHPIRRYVQDRTPIEDTESTIDLAVKGWRVHNHNAVLAWSATPQDFGALVVQRRRWACGGLIVLPKAAKAALVSDADVGRRLLQLVVRTHYLGSLFWGPAALLALLVVPFDKSLAGVFLPLVAIPYFAAYALDLILSKRPLKDMVSVYGLNLVLVPVNLAGAFASLRQAVTGRKVPFARTPKVESRTAAPSGILAALWGGSAFLIASAGFDTWLGDLPNAAFAGINGIALLAATQLYVGWHATRADVTASVRDLRRRRRRVRPRPPLPGSEARSVGQLELSEAG